MYQDSGFKRNPNEKFYTKTNIAKTCIQYFIQLVQPKTKHLIIEPSAGNGAFSNHLIKTFKNVRAIDIDKELDYVIKQDFLTYQPSIKNPIHIIGNPPFGRQLSLVRKFIQHSATFAKTISFILPNSFRKISVQKMFPTNFHLIYEWELPKNSFYIANNKDHHVPCIFQIWKNLDSHRQIPDKLDALYFNFLKYGDNNIDFAIRRVGGTAGKLYTNWKKCAIQSHYFIQLHDNIDKSKFIELYKNIVFASNNTVGPRSISKPELIHEMNQLKI